MLGHLSGALETEWSDGFLDFVADNFFETDSHKFCHDDMASLQRDPHYRHLENQMKGQEKSLWSQELQGLTAKLQKNKSNLTFLTEQPCLNGIRN